MLVSLPATVLPQHLLLSLPLRVNDVTTDVTNLLRQLVLVRVLPEVAIRATYQTRFGDETADTRIQVHYYSIPIVNLLNTQ
jgi:hypothetical protein